METKKVAWNASQGLIIEISNRRSLANTYYIKGNLKDAINTLISIKQSVIQSFVQKEREDLTKIEEKFNRISPALSKSFSTSFNNKEKNISILANKLAKKIYSEYNELLMDLLEDRGYLIGEQTDASKMKF